MKNNNPKLQKLLHSDQKARQDPKNIDWKKLLKEDSKRRSQVWELYTKGQLLTSEDFFNAGLIFQHGIDTEDFFKAQTFAKKSLDMGFKEAGWLYGATTDRLLVSKGKKQRYGTQYHTIAIYNSKTKKETYRYELAPYDKRISDSSREKLGIPKLKQLKNEAKNYTKSIYES